MSTTTPKNISTSIRQRLLNLSQLSKRPFQEILQYYAMERFIHRFSLSPYKDKLILKGGLMFYVWHLASSRATRDIDFLGITPNNPNNIHKIITQICDINYSNDGMIFIKDNIQCIGIQEQNEYTGIRATLFATLEQAKIKLQIDIGFGDIIHPNPIDFHYPTLLDMQTPQIKGYTPETLIAEKLHTMLRHGSRNSRMKDIYDIWLLSRQFQFNGQTLKNAIIKTLSNRGLTLDNHEPLIFTDDYKDDKNRNQQWNAFIRKSTLSITPANFSEAMDQIKLFTQPMLESYSSKAAFNKKWLAPGPWTTETSHNNITELHEQKEFS
jgi:hypothetical protein